VTMQRGTPESPEPLRAVGRRLRRIWLVLVYVGLFAWFDWIAHRDVLFLAFAVLVVAMLLLAPEIGQAVSRLQGGRYAAGVAQLTKLIHGFPAIPPIVRPFLLAIPGLSYLVARGQGTAPDGMALVVVVTVLSFLVVVVVAGGRIDAGLAPYFAIRNRVPRIARLVIAPIVSIIVAFLVVHQDLGDLPALWGGTTNTRHTPADVDLWLFGLAALLASVLSYLLIHEAAQPVSTAATVSVPVKMATLIGRWRRGATWMPDYVVPDGGGTWWPLSSGQATPLPAGTELAQLWKSDMWTLVAMADDGRGWVDPSRLQVATRADPTMTHDVAADAKAWPVDPPFDAVRTLLHGSGVAVAWSDGPWARVITTEGWQGWLAASALEVHK
jgi:hypothetical protein